MIKIKNECQQTCKRFLFCARIWVRVKPLKRRIELGRSRISNFVECGTSDRRRSNIPSRKISETKKDEILLPMHHLHMLLMQSMVCFGVIQCSVTKAFISKMQCNAINTCKTATWLLGRVVTSISGPIILSNHMIECTVERNIRQNFYQLNICTNYFLKISLFQRRIFSCIEINLFFKYIISLIAYSWIKKKKK